MKTFSKLFLGIALSGMMVSCSSDEPGNGTKEESKGDFYSTLTLKLPVGSRSQTTEPDENTNSNSGFEIGQDYENSVQKVTVVLATLENGAYRYLAEADGVTGTLTGPGSSTTHPSHIKYNLKFQSSDLVDRAGEKIYVFAFANTPESVDLKEALSNGTLSIDNADNNDIWANGSFMMTNASITQNTLPTASAITQNTEENPFDLGTVEIERVTSRFDFRATNNNVYPITEVGEDVAKAQVTLDGMAMVNIAKEYYVLPRVSADGLNENATICGAETPSMWVVSPNSTFKLNPVWANSDQYFFNATGTYTTGFDFTTLNYTTVASILSKGEDNDDNWTLGEGIDKTGYHIWRYTTENTIPKSDKYAAQKHGITTAIYFRANLTAAEGNTTLAEAMEAGHVLYALNGVLYGDKAAVEKYIATNKVSSLAEEWAKAAVADNLDANGDLRGHGASEITIYRAEGTAGNYTYPMYYCYYNRHNDNLDNNVMAPMEFGTVRNNVYKLAITNIMHYGHPGKPGDDPDPEDPDDPDEDPEIWFSVDLHVLPWVVRVNNIEF